MLTWQPDLHYFLNLHTRRYLVRRALWPRRCGWFNGIRRHTIWSRLDITTRDQRCECNQYICDRGDEWHLWTRISCPRTSLSTHFFFALYTPILIMAQAHPLNYSASSTEEYYSDRIGYPSVLTRLKSMNITNYSMALERMPLDQESGFGESPKLRSLCVY